jgi:hypothetical protein
MYVRTYSLFNCGRLSTNIKLIVHKDLIASVMTYACPTWKHAEYAEGLNLAAVRPTTVQLTHCSFKVVT